MTFVTLEVISMKNQMLVPAIALLAACSQGSGAAAQSSGGGQPFTLSDVATFEEPFALAFLPDGAALVTEKSGHLQLLRKGEKQAVEVAGVPDVAAGGQGGLLDIAPAPDYATSHAVYLSYSEPRPGGSGLALARATLMNTAAPALAGLQVIWRSGSDGKGGQFGAIIAFAPDGRSLFLSSGERQRFTPAQDPNQALGKILHLTLDGKPAPGNPWAGKAGTGTAAIFDPPRNTGSAADAPSHPGAADPLAPAETWSTGHRNPYGLAFGPDGRLWEHEMGPKGGDEVNLILPGRNYGWPNASNGSNYDGTDIPDHKPGDGYEPPKVFWNPSISPSGLIVYTGGDFPQWRGSILMGAMSGQALIRIALDGDKASKADQWNLGMRIRDVAQAPDGSVWLLQDGDGAKLMKLVPVR
jgi:glucose/arabinose dehydrogenase